ncbi:DNA-processing protein DprA [Leuconostoc lactis]|uniref:DNA-processing protein DprA n=1 Tax=Leuconostoc lactis TaxID=1246 RepID=UPI0006DC890C|nr:DNA-processing protein DprA [Leuconostoc lactis]KQB81233.1 DNA processing protein DprA [Leuconostoc lactis]QEA47834.1 DNA-protecting protein DprA [Leuconostoc lactis]HBP98434.1 DNA-protecting protein DprA [Leuconostoc lactis]
MNLNQQLLAIHLTAGMGVKAARAVITAVTAVQVPTIYPWPLDLILSFGDQRSHHLIRRTYSSAVERVQQWPTSYMTYFDACYPGRLREIYDAPLVLFYQGHLAALRLPSLSVVGTRTATPYGLAVLRSLLPDVVIVSGLAKGIDVMAHQMTLAQRGVPIAVIGTGIDVAYPKAHHHLQTQIGEQGLVLSEYPPGTGPQKSHFPARNRIIAGLSSATLVVEAKQHSGSLITANFALQENRDVLAVPGTIFSATAQGTHELIQLGAKLVAKPTDILESVQNLDTI